ncbi:MAG: hypothetical protein J6C42_03980, partial [Clostridia bacterium]|nr:hypothetical protein [Clostridia bacterium]
AHDITETEMICAEQNGVLRSRSPISHSFYHSTAAGETNFSRTPPKIPQFHSPYKEVWKGV